MSKFTFQEDPRLPDNVLAVHTDEQDEKYALEHGIDPERDRPGATVTDMKPDHEDGSITQIEYNFISKSGIYVHFRTTHHRHDDGPDLTGDGDCDEFPAKEKPAPDEVRELIMEAMDAPVAGGQEADDE